VSRPFVVYDGADITAQVRMALGGSVPVQGGDVLFQRRVGGEQRYEAVLAASDAGSRHVLRQRLGMQIARAAQGILHRRRIRAGGNQATMMLASTPRTTWQVMLASI